ncbi:lachesin isoform X1 [Drosophila willistoni]|uniref:lachesin isoform X1 n=1 Tax=Drosophila willistoni TaxID=7260 RepID=UPI000C26CF90|nr:lachesin isoform X1 [Drosophila willistoni]
MELKKWNLHVPWFLLLLSSTHSDVGKKTSFQNHFGSPLQNQFNTKNNTRVIAQKGGLAILPCVVKINSPATVSWIRRKDFQLLTLGLSTHSSDKRFLVEHTRHMGHWSLRIKAVREEDRGFYECQLSIYPTQSIFIELKIVEAAAEISSAPELHIDEASTLRLECKLKRATENPSFVFW